MSLRTAAAFAAALTAIDSWTLAAQEIVELKPGLVSERAIGMNEVHRYSARLQPGQVLRVVVDQRGVDVVLKLYGPDGAKIREFDGPTGAKGPDQLSFLADTGGTYKVEVVPFPSQATPGAGKYEIRVIDLRSATPEESASAAVERALAVLERRWDDAVRTRDMNALNGLMADDYTNLASAGGLNSTREQTKQTFADLTARERGKSIVISDELTDTDIRVVGDTAIATGHATITARTPDRQSKVGGRFIHTWQKRGGEWRVVADHWDPEGAEPPPVKLVALSPAVLDSFVGLYDFGVGPVSTLTISRAGDALAFKNDWDWAETFQPASSTEFFAKSDGNSRALFLRNDAGQVSEVLLISAGRATRASRRESGR